MPITEASRHHMISQLEQAIGKKATMTLAEHLPPVGWAEVATKSDIENLRAATKTDIDSLRAATKTDIDSLRAATKTDIEHLRDSTKSDIGAVESRMLAALHEGLHKQTLWVIGGVAGITTFILGLFRFIFG